MVKNKENPQFSGTFNLCPLISNKPDRSKLWIACSDFLQKSERAHAAALLYRKKSRSARQLWIGYNIFRKLKKGKKIDMLKKLW